MKKKKTKIVVVTKKKNKLNGQEQSASKVGLAF